MSCGAAPQRRSRANLVKPKAGVIYHGLKRTSDPAELAAADVALTLVSLFLHPEITATQVVIYHGGKRTSDPAELAAADVVLTTYSIVESEYRKNCLPGKVPCRYCRQKMYPDRLKLHLKCDFFCTALFLCLSCQTMNAVCTVVVSQALPGSHLRSSVCLFLCRRLRFSPFSIASFQSLCSPGADDDP